MQSLQMAFRAPLQRSRPNTASNASRSTSKPKADLTKPVRTHSRTHSTNYTSGLAATIDRPVLRDANSKGPPTPGRSSVKAAVENEPKRVIQHTRNGSYGDRISSGSHSRKSSISEPVQPKHTRRLSLEIAPKRQLQVEFACKTKVGFSASNPDKVNQDSWFAITQLKPGVQFYSVCDGHGHYGHHVSGRVKQRLPELLAREPALLTEPAKALRLATLRCDAELNQSEIDVRFSGTTMVSVLLCGKVLYCANSGDSRAVLARQVTHRTTGKSRQWMAVALSRDHKPDEEDEAARILARGGRIEAYRDENGDPLGPARVWLQDHQLPGLAMSRSLGDAVAASVGVTAEPEILECSLSPDDRFIVIASDGVFEFLSSEDVVRIVAPYWKVHDVQGASERLVQEAELRWTEEEDVVDDITALVLFLDVPAN